MLNITDVKTNCCYLSYLLHSNSPEQNELITLHITTKYIYWWKEDGRMNGWWWPVKLAEGSTSCFIFLQFWSLKTYQCLTVVMGLYQPASTSSHKCLQGLILGFLCPFNNTFQQHMLCKVPRKCQLQGTISAFPFRENSCQLVFRPILNSEIPKCHSTVFNKRDFRQAYFLFYVIHINVLRDGTTIQNIYFWHYSVPVLGKTHFTCIILFSGNHGTSGHPMPLEERVASLKYLWITFHVLQLYIQGVPRGMCQTLGGCSLC